jgi:hypothetical protein
LSWKGRIDKKAALLFCFRNSPDAVSWQNKAAPQPLFTPLPSKGDFYWTGKPTAFIR